ncbi:MAG: 50S ribosomal protein L24 [Candidatus Blackburnbacteria bacterium]|nr:50S ribosomal protein L24 [Candidatus Blackburnbacteria bacterium]
MKLHIGDEILVTAGKDKGRKGKVEKVFPGKGLVLVPQLNVYKKTRRGYGDQKGGIFEVSRPLRVANVALICPNCKKATRVGYRVLENGQKERICRRCKRQVDKGETKQ